MNSQDALHGTVSLGASPENPGRYRLLNQLGQGGMGTVYLAQDTKLDRQVAIKVLPAHYGNDSDAIARFQREARALAKLSHSGIVQAFDSDAVEGRHFLVMEYVEGTSLAALLKDQGRIAPALAADYIHQAAMALHHAHEKGLVHRDLKPSNLLLTPGGQVKILDLGLARFMQDQIGDPNVTREGAGLGTPDYAAPEQFRDAHSADIRSDIYSLGCTLYHLLAGQVPFPGSSLAEKCRAHEHQEPPPLENLCPEAPVGLTLALSKMMAKQPDARFQSAEEVAQALAPFVGAASSSSRNLRSTATWYRGQLTLAEFKVPPKRRRILTRALLAGLLLLAVLAGFFLGNLGDPSSHPVHPETLAQKEPKGQPYPDGEKQDQPRPTGDVKERKKIAKDSPGKASPKKNPLPVMEEDPMVLTVSQDPGEGGKFRTLKQALAEVKPGMTIRVLDDKTYTESLSLTLPSQHRGITLEAPRRALIRNPSAKILLAIFSVPEVTVRGFRFQGDGENSYVLGVVGRSPGVCLEDLQIEADIGRPVFGVTLEHLDSPQGIPVVVRNCRFRTLSAGIRVSGWGNHRLAPDPCRHLALRKNTFIACAGGIVLQGSVSHLQAVGNIFVGGSETGFQFNTLLSPTQDILVANNTFFECSRPFSLLGHAAKGVPGKTFASAITFCWIPRDRTWSTSIPAPIQQK